MSDLAKRAWHIFKFKRWFMFGLALLNLFPAAWLLVHAPGHPVLAVFNAAEWMVTWACFEAGFTAKQRKQSALRGYKSANWNLHSDWTTQQYWRD